MAAPKEVAEAIQAIASSYGQIRPDAVVKAAEDPSSVLHRYFTWDDSEAAAAHRLYEARKLIREVKITWTTQHYRIEVPLYVRDPSQDKTTQGYVDVTALRTDRNYALDTLDNEMVRLNATLRRIRGIATVLGLEDELDELLERAGALPIIARGPR